MEKLLAEQAEVQEIIEQLPIFEFIKYKIHTILVHDSELFRFPKIHMN
jgi:hypothetical protein